jgi:NADPH-dependent ferric siderophore reductase
MPLLTDLARHLMQPATLVAAERVAAHTYRLSLSGPALVGWAYVPGQTLNVFFGLTARADAASLRKRTYSIWGYDGAAGRLELAVCTFSDGPGAQWAAACRPGDLVHFYGPGGNFVLDPTAPAYALLGDIACLAHFYELRRQLPAPVPVVSVIHARHAEDCFADVDGSWPLQFVVADTVSATQVLAAAQQQGLQLTAPQALVYWGGPQGLCVAGHRLLQHDYHWPARLLKTKPFWK